MVDSIAQSRNDFIIYISLSSLFPSCTIRASLWHLHWPLSLFHPLSIALIALEPVALLNACPRSRNIVLSRILNNSKI